VTEKSEFRNAERALTRVYCNAGVLQVLKGFADIGYMFVSVGRGYQYIIDVGKDEIQTLYNIVYETLYGLCRVIEAKTHF